MASQYEKDIEEILEGLGDLPITESPRQQFQRQWGRRARNLWWDIKALPSTIAADQLMIVALLCVVAAFFLRFMMPGVARFVGLAGLVLFIAAFAFSFNRFFGGGGREVRWRGQVIDLQSGQPSTIDRFIIWMRRKMRGL